MFEIKKGWRSAVQDAFAGASISKFRRVTSIFLVGLGLFVTGFGINELYAVNQNDVTQTEQANIAICEKKADFEQITVYISGAVNKPGLYVLEEGSRRADVVQLAGGLSSAADTVTVHKGINFAALLSDGENIYIPNKSEKLSEFVRNTSKEIEAKNEKDGSPISINTSDTKTLQQLNGIGEVRAQKIIENRPFGSLEELVNNGIISASVYEKNKEKMTL